MRRTGIGFSTVSQLVAAVFAAVLLVGCAKEKPKYIIGVSQCSEDSWRAKLQQELDMATYFNEGVELRYASAHDDSKVQQEQIDSLLESGIQLLIVSPNQTDNLSNIINKVYDNGIPVILYDRKTSSQKYTAFMGADNFLIGEMLGRFVAARLGGKGKVVEIGGLKGSSPAQERHDGFVKAMKAYPGIEIVAYQSGDWTEASGEVAMRRILKDYAGEVDAVFGGNDRMAVGARRVLKEEGRAKPTTLYVGVDALPNGNGGIGQVADSVLTASVIYPTRGDELLELAIKILDGEQVPKDISMKSSIVTADNAKVLLLQHEEVVRRADYLKKMHSQAGRMHESIRSQQVVIGLVLTLVLLVSVMLVIAMVGYRTKHHLSEELGKRNEELDMQHRQLADANEQLTDLNAQLTDANSQLMHEKEVAEQQRDELEEQRDKIIEMSLNQKADGDRANGSDGGDDILDGNEKHFRRENEFLKKFIGTIEQHISDADLSVEDLGSEMCLSRVQLYRKVKALTGKSPVEIVREERLKRGHQLLADSSLTISEIAYRVGFSSPSYFAKCYRSFFGKSPTEVQKM